MTDHIRQTLFHCRSCGSTELHHFLDLGLMPLANTLPQSATAAQPRYPLSAVICRDCRLVQLTHEVPPSVIYHDYPYFSSFSSSWVEHARRYALLARDRLNLGPDSMVVEIASNDGYLLRHFIDMGIPVLGVEPAETVAAAAREQGVPTECIFFGAGTADQLRERGIAADLMVSNNVLAHVPDLNDFVAGFARLLKPSGVWSCEFPHLLRMLEGVQFDTIYHEHFCYFSLLAVEKILARHGLAVFDIDELPTHGGSLRLWIAHAGTRTVGERVTKVRADEKAAGLDGDAAYERFADQVRHCLDSLRAFLATARVQGRRVAGYGAAAKSATLLGACGVKTTDIAFIADLNPNKQGRFIPGTDIPVVAPDRIFTEQPDYVLILPWNLQNEITAQLAGIRDWGGRFVVAVPETVILP